MKLGGLFAFDEILFILSIPPILNKSCLILDLVLHIFHMYCLLLVLLCKEL